MLRGIYLVIAVTSFFPLGMVVTYTLAVLSDHVKPVCYISYTGNYPIESCIFSFIFNACSAGYICIVFLRYVQLSTAPRNSNISDKQYKCNRSLNLMSLLLGTGGALGLSVAGNFQQRTFHLVHVIGVLFCTYSTLGFTLLQTYFTFTLSVLETSHTIKTLRFTVVLLAVFILATAPILVIYNNLRGNSHHGFSVFASAPQNDNEVLTVGAVYEWTLFFLYQTFIASFFQDFKKITLVSNKIVFSG